MCGNGGGGCLCVVMVVVVGYWWWCSGDSLCKGDCCNRCRFKTRWGPADNRPSILAPSLCDIFFVE